LGYLTDTITEAVSPEWYVGDLTTIERPMEQF
jgi:hypothetical protein